ncbi:unnamed protein product [Camellia sinensis]
MKHGHVPEACVLVSDTCRTRTRVRHAVDTCPTLSPACPPFFRIFQSRTRGWTREDTIQTRRWVDRRSPRTVGEEKEREPETETDRGKRERDRSREERDRLRTEKKP